MAHVVDAVCELSQPTAEHILHAREATNAVACCNSENVVLNDAVVLIQMVVVRPQRWVTSEYQSGVDCVRVHVGSEDVEFPDVLLAQSHLPRAVRDTEPIGHRDDCARDVTRAAVRDSGYNIAHNLDEGSPRCVDG